MERNTWWITLYQRHPRPRSGLGIHL